MDRLRSASRVAIVTGANAGIGRTIAEALALQGIAVVVHYLDGHPPVASTHRIEHTIAGREAAEAVVRGIVDGGGHATAVAADLADPASAAALFDQAEAAFGAVSILVNNAAHCESPDTTVELTAGGFDRHFQVNTRAPVLLTGELARRARARGLASARVINISTDAARAFAGQVAYGASKAALEAFTRSMAIELGPLGSTVNAVAPGPIQTGWIGPDLEAQVLPQIPLGRVGTPQDIAHAVAFFASEQADWITGQVLQVAGGHALQGEAKRAAG